MPSGYYQPDQSPPVLIEFPKGERFDSSPNERAISGMTARRRTGITLETEEGAFHKFKQSNRRRWRLVYKVTEIELQIFRDLDDAVDGDGSSFLFVPNVDDPSTTYLVRKVADFDPPPTGNPTRISGFNPPIAATGEKVNLFDYVLEMIEESEAGQILA